LSISDIYLEVSYGGDGYHDRLLLLGLVKVYHVEFFEFFEPLYIGEHHWFLVLSGDQCTCRMSPCMNSLHEDGKRTRQEIVVLLHAVKGIIFYFFKSFFLYSFLNYFVVSVNGNEKILRILLFFQHILLVANWNTENTHALVK